MSMSRISSVSTPDVIIIGSTPAALALKAATRTIPIVFGNIADPVANGVVPSLARPGGNITGFAAFEETTAGKWLELLKEIAPRDRVGHVFGSTAEFGPNGELFLNCSRQLHPRPRWN